MRRLWKKGVSVLAAAAMIGTGIPGMATLQVNAQGDNLVTNGGFEDDLTGWDNWSEVSDFQITEDSEHVKEGSKALFVESSNQDWVGLTQNVSVERNTDYEFSFWGKNESMFCYKIMDSSWNSTLNVEQYPTGNGEYQEYSGTFNSGENDTVIFYISDAATNGYYDEIRIEKAGEDPVEVEFDGGFESGSLAGWQNNDAPDRFTVSAEETYEGEYALKISSASQDWSCIKYNLPVDTNYMYRISFYAKGESTSYFKVINKGMTTELVGGIPSNTAEEWTLNTYEFNSKSNDEVVLYFADTAGTVYIDGIVIERLQVVPVTVTEVINGDFSDGLNGWDTSAAGDKFTVEEGQLHINSEAEDGNYIQQQIPVTKGTYYSITKENTGADIRYLVLDAENTVLADESDAYFCVGNNATITLRLLDTAENAVVDNVVMEEALILPVNNRAAVNAPGEITEVELVDADATAVVRSLYVYLQEVGKENLLFGHQTDNSESIVKNEGIISDTYHTVGAYPAITGFEMANIVSDMDSYVQLVQQAYENNSIATVCDHMPNFSSEAEGSSFSDMTPTYEHIMPGGKDHEKFLARLDQTAEFALSCVDENGELIPIIYRPFHENSGMWFWWGVSNTSKDQFVNLWRFTVEYLRDEKGVHNLLYAYSPNGHFSSEDNYLSRYPGDDYVDIIGFDIYHDNPTYESKWMQQTLKDAQIAASIAAKKGKVAAITEMGIRHNGSDGLAVEDNAMKDWYALLYETLMNDEDAKQIAYMMTWRNQDKTHFWVPYDDGEGDRHEMANDFTVFYNHDDVIFADRLGNFADLQNIETIEHEAGVYFVAPTTGEKIKGTAEVLLKVDAEVIADVEQVMLCIGEDTFVAEYEEPYFVVALDTTIYTDGNYELKAKVVLNDESEFEASKMVKIWNDESASDVDISVFDDFDGYFGDTEQLNQAYNRNTNGDVNEVSLIDSPFGAEYGKAMKFDYSVSTGGPGYTGTAKTLNYDITSMDTEGIAFWYQGDGLGADILLQVNMPNCFEAHLNDLESFDKESTQPQYIEISWDEFAPKGHTAQKDLSNIQTYAIYVNGTGIEDSTLIFDEICVIRREVPDMSLEAFVERMYTTVLGRDAVESEVNDWVDNLRNQRVDGAKLANGFVNSDEFKGKNVSDSVYVDVLYRALMNREGDEEGKNGWLNGLAGGMTREDVLNQFIISAEFGGLCEDYGIVAKLTEEQLVTKFVERMYSVVLGRTASETEVNGWAEPLLSWRIDGATLANRFINSEEFKDKNVSNSDYLDVLYRAIMNREADAAGKDGWMNGLAGGMTREAVLDAFVTSDEFERLCDEYGICAILTEEDQVRGFVQRLYTLVLGREATSEEVDGWAQGLLNQYIYGAQVANDFINSAEFTNKNVDNAEYIEVLYKALLNREPVAEETESWVNHLENGMTRDAILSIFLNSDEFGTICENYGILRGDVQ